MAQRKELNNIRTLDRFKHFAEWGSSGGKRAQVRSGVGRTAMRLGIGCEMSSIVLDDEEVSSEQVRAFWFASRAARRLWVESGQADGELVDPVALAWKLGCSVKFAAMNPDGVSSDDRAWVSGALVRDEKRIIVERRDPIGRQRFSVAHELAHLVNEVGSPGQELVVPIEVRRPNDRPELDSEYFSVNPKEYYADVFALALLMPTEAIASVAEQPKEAGLQDAASKLMVSEESLRRRLYYFELENACATGGLVIN